MTILRATVLGKGQKNPLTGAITDPGGMRHVSRIEKLKSAVIWDTTERWFKSSTVWSRKRFHVMPTIMITGNIITLSRTKLRSIETRAIYIRALFECLNGL